jgi:hypothetical protein
MWTPNECLQEDQRRLDRILRGKSIGEPSAYPARQIIGYRYRCSRSPGNLFGEAASPSCSTGLSARDGNHSRGRRSSVNS